MAFVFDHTDPSSLGMFSKAGRFTSEKHIIFQSKDEILNGQRKFLKVTALPHIKMDFAGKDQNHSLHEEDNKPKAVSPKKAKTPHAAPFSLQMSREDFYQSKRVKHPPPPCAFYHPKYDYVDKTPRTIAYWSKEKSKSEVFPSAKPFFSVEEASRPLPKKLSKKLVGPLPLKLQTPRSNKNHGCDPHENRFTVVEPPKVWSNTPRITTIDMKKSRGRDNQFFKTLEFAPDYEPNFEVGKKKIGSPGPKFEFNSPRKDVVHYSYCSSDNFFTPDKSEKLVTKRTREVVIDRYIPRDSDPSSPLPSFMQKSINSRMTIGTLSQKMLEINNYYDGKFQSVTSSFYSPSAARKTDL